MPSNSDADLFAELRKIDTPSITNVVATYPTNPICLGLYNPWSENWYTDTSIRCMYPELGAVAGYAVTCVYSVPDPNYNRLTFMDVIDALDASPKPTILVLQQKFPPELAAKAGLAGEIMVTSMQAVGCVGLVSNGPSRDIDAIRALRFQYLLSGASAGHGGMDVQPGEIVHMDENGACKFPADKLDAVLANVKVLLKDEASRLTALRQAKTAAEVRAAFGGAAYSDPKSSAPKR
jgi:4-hydroxy-4-methyl-2-oxoglutarate aldolase